MLTGGKGLPRAQCESRQHTERGGQLPSISGAYSSQHAIPCSSLTGGVGTVRSTWAISEAGCNTSSMKVGLARGQPSATPLKLYREFFGARCADGAKSPIRDSYYYSDESIGEPSGVSFLLTSRTPRGISWGCSRITAICLWIAPKSSADRPTE